MAKSLQTFSSPTLTLNECKALYILLNSTDFRLIDAMTVIPIVQKLRERLPHEWLNPTPHDGPTK